jgi:hypothetical protein
MRPGLRGTLFGLTVAAVLSVAGCTSSHAKAAPPASTTTTVAVGATNGTVTTPPTTSPSVPPTTALAVPTLGSATALTSYTSAPGAEGFGQVKPNTVYLGGDPTGRVDGITWQTWGGQQASGTGTGNWVGPGQIVAQATPQPVTITASDLGMCGSQYMYRAVQWFFAGEGQTSTSNPPLYLCVLEHPPSGIEFWSPSRNISCQIDYGPPYPDKQVYCQSLSPAQSVTMSTTGTYKTCAGTSCLGNPATNSLTLAYGDQISLGPFQCLSRTDGVTCTASGKGFQISKSGVVSAPQ